MNKYLLGNLEDETPDVLDKIGCQRQGRGVLGLFLVAFFALFLNGKVLAQDPTSITSLSQISSSNGNYIITHDITGGTPAVTSFTGTLTAQAKSDGTFPVISGLTQPLFTTVTDATISNIMLKNVAISQAGYVGAIACTANGDSRIYNCGILPNNPQYSDTSTVASTNSYCGSLVGFLDGQARVVNCFSYANITSGTVKAGIVGYNNYASKYNDLKTMVMNCMFYGNITEGGTIVPIYGGENISNDYNNSTSNRLNNYNYYLYEAPFSKNNAPNQNNQIITAYNCALAAERRFLVRFEFYRHLLNSTRELAAWYATGTAVQSVMLKWVIDKGIAPYPILKVQGKYPSVVNYDPTYTYINGVKHKRDTITVRDHGGRIKVNGQAQTLKVYVSNSNSAGGGQAWPEGASVEEQFRPGNAGITLYRLDKDTANYNFNYDKVQLPYYNDVGSGNYTYNKVVTGWKIISMEGGTGGGYTETNYDNPHYNYADRDHYGKDIYPKNTTNKTSGRIYSQGGYFNVPTGVTSITIEPYWGKAAYLSDANYDRYGYKNDDDLTQIGDGPRYTNGTQCPVLEGTSGQANEQKVYTTFANALATLTGVNNATVYDYAVVLVGNYHHHAKLGKEGPELSEGSTPFTIMSVDLNEDNEPDYCLVFRSGKNRVCSPIRYDFITVPGMVMAHKMASHGDLGIPGNCCPRGWFEITTTGLIKFGQFEHSYNNKSLAPVIFMGGVIDQFVANNTQNHGSNASYNDKTRYMLFGDNVWFKMLSNGTHMDNTAAVPRRPISLVGGEFEKLYLTGFFSPSANACTAGSGDNNAECYIDGGRFGEVAGAAQENISGTVTWLIDHADMESFFGGGVKASDDNQITGDISTTIKNSHVDLFCGGPKFGDMAADKTVTNTATNCEFGTFFGAGYGGTSIYRECPSAYNLYQDKNYPFNDWVSGSYGKSTGASYRGKYTSGKGVACGFEYELFAGSAGNVGRLYLQYASFTLAQTNDVTSTLTGCTITRNFYGGGSLGKVDGDVTSTLDGCTVYGSVFGAGFSATIPQASVINIKSNGEGFITPPNYNETTGVYEPPTYPRWNGSVYVPVEDPDTTCYKWIHVNSLSGGTQALDETNHTIKTTADVTALGTVSGNVTLNLTGNTTVEGKIFNNNGAVIAQTGGVYGGGDESGVTGTDKTVEVNINTTSSDHTTKYINNVFGGGNKANVKGIVEVNIGSGDGASPYILHDVNGGGALAMVNVTETPGANPGDPPTYSYTENTTTTVTLTKGIVAGSIYGGGLGDNTSGSEVAANVYGPVTVSINGGTVNNVFGCNNLYGAPQSTVVVNIEPTSTTLSNVYGGGNMASYLDTPDVNIIGGTINGDVFGGGKNANVGGGDVVMTGGTVLGSLYGGGENGNVNGDTQVDITGGTLGSSSNLENLTLSNVFGGGYGAGTSVSGDVEVNFSDGTIYGDVYGGSALGAVNTDENNTTTVNILGGTLETKVTTGTAHNGEEVNIYNGGNVYGGGLGFKDENDPTNDVEAMVYGVVKVNIGAGMVTDDATLPTGLDGDATIKGNVYGCNNTNGSPQQNVTVNIFQMAANHTLHNVFGGGNRANFEVNGKTATVNIYTCDNQIERVFGGGNAAATKSVRTMIQGGTFTEVYGGGNGEVSAANVNGTATLDIHGGDIEQTFAGSNQQGSISGGSMVTVDNNGPCPNDVDIEDLFCGSNYADVSSDIVTTVACSDAYVHNLYGGCNQAHVVDGHNITLTVNGGIYDNIYGGSKGTSSEGADIAGNVTLNIHGGTVYNAIFGGSNIKGNIGGNITVNIEQKTGTDYCAFDLSEADVYGGGNQAAYTPQSPGYPQVNIKHGTVKNVYGGGLGATAIVTSNPKVTIGDNNATYQAVVRENVYGGGNAAGVSGNTEVLLKDHAKVNGNIYGGGNMGEVSGNTKVIINGKNNTGTGTGSGNNSNND